MDIKPTLSRYVVAIALTAMIAAETLSPAMAASKPTAKQLTTVEKAGIRCVSAGAIVGFFTFITTFSPSAATAAATVACVLAGGEEAIALELQNE